VKISTHLLRLFKKENGFGSAFFAQYVVDDVGKSPCTLKNTCS
jgi:hypothetical protein